MDYAAVVAALRAERDEVTKAILCLERISGIRRRRGRPPGKSLSSSDSKTARQPSKSPGDGELPSAAAAHL